MDHHHDSISTVCASRNRSTSTLVWMEYGPSAIALSSKTTIGSIVLLVALLGGVALYYYFYYYCRSQQDKRQSTNRSFSINQRHKARQQFCCDYPEYNVNIERRRRIEFPGLYYGQSNNKDGLVYLDYAGASLPSASQLEASVRHTQLLGNPHSTGPLSSVTHERIQATRLKLLEFLDADQYQLYFTSGTTHSLRLIAELVDIHTLIYPQQVHTSVIGLRQFSKQFYCRPWSDLQADILAQSTDKWLKDSLSNRLHGRHHLLALPLECNFGGDVIQNTKALLSKLPDGMYSLLDVAKAAATGPVSLNRLRPDFCVLSWYKIFGAPTGLGALFIRKHLLHQLSSLQYVGGGNVNVVVPASNYAVAKELDSVEHLSSGTVHYRGICELQSGLEEIERLGGMMAIHNHANALAEALVRRLRALIHAGTHQPAVRIYSQWAKNNSFPNAHGPTVAFNMMRSDGTIVGYNEVSKLAVLNCPPIQLRTGCFCNPGACQLALGLRDEDVIRNFKESGHKCGDDIDIINGRPTGAVRASFGKDSVWDDVDALVLFLEKLFVNQTNFIPERIPDTSNLTKPFRARISELYVFPIKSCAAQRVASWPMNATSGRLLYDREFALVDSSGTAMRLQTYPKMALIRPFIDLENKTLTLSAPRSPQLEVGLDTTIEQGPSGVRVCGNRCSGRIWGGQEASNWFGRVLGVKCWLARYNEDYVPNSGRDGAVAFANEKPLLLISSHAVDVLNGVLAAQSRPSVCSKHFRPNVVVAGNVVAHQPQACLEERWSHVELCRQKMTLRVVGPCARCSMVDVDPTSGSKGNTLRALAEYKRTRRGQITFGIFLAGTTVSKSSDWIRLSQGDELACQ